MQLPLKPLLCRHDFYWSERHGSDRCRRCGKRQAAEAIDIPTGETFSGAGPAEGRADGPDLMTAWGISGEPGAATVRLPARSPSSMRPSTKVLKAQAEERRDQLLGLLNRLAEGGRPTREEAIDALLAVIEDAHSADPLLFGADAAGHFARLHQARSARLC